jgi:hypothetical protein
MNFLKKYGKIFAVAIIFLLAAITVMSEAPVKTVQAQDD